jgi:16S rRNA (guanine966-N2)-methyltransferase
MAQLQVMGGELGGRRLRASKEIRPTTGRVREAMFSILGDVTGARVLDLFCGSGALGIEALSRGAAAATLVDTDPAEAEANVEDLGLGERADVVRSDAARFLRDAEPESFDLILCDPPYRLADRLAGDLDPLIHLALVPGGRAVIESDPKRAMQMSLPLSTERLYGDTMLRVHIKNDTELAR